MFQAESTIRLPKMRADRTLSFTVDIARELNAEQMAAVMGLAGKEGWFLFKENEVQEADIPTENAEIEEKKSQGQRLRGALYVLWKKATELGKTQKSFDQFKRDWYEKQITKVKDSIDEL